MDYNAVVQSLDAEIDRLSQARALLTNSPNLPLGHRFNVIPGGRKKRILSADARARIAAAQRRRWAKQKATKKAA